MTPIDMIQRTMPLLVVAVFYACNGGAPAEQAIKAPIADTTVVAARPANGPQVIHLKEGGRMEGVMRNGERTGSWISYHPNGVIWSRSVYRNGVEHGPTEVFHDNGRTYYLGAYEQGKPSGEWIFYDANGVETKRVKYDGEGNVLESGH